MSGMNVTMKMNTRLWKGENDFMWNSHVRIKHIPGTCAETVLSDISHIN